MLDDLPVHLAQGMFARPGTHPVVLRISTNPGDILDDTVSSPRGLAMKIIGVLRARLPGALPRCSAQQPGAKDAARTRPMPAPALWASR